VYRRQGTLAIIDYFDFGLPPQFACGIRTPDTLTIATATLVRRTPVNGVGTIEEFYERR
jgi:hypothetical protein